MPSTFAWLDHSESDRRKALDIVDLFREQDIAQLRDEYVDDVDALDKWGEGVT